MIAVIMAGGKGTRLAKVAPNLPKPMVPVCNKPVLEHQIESLKGQGIMRFILIVGHLKEVIIDYFKDGSSFGVEISYITENEPLGTGGALFYLKDKIGEDFLLVFGDIMLDIDWPRFVDFHIRNKSDATLFAHPNSHPYDSDLVVCDHENQVISWDSKINSPRGYYYKNLVNAGLYVLSTKVFNYTRTLERKDFEKDILLKMVADNYKVYAYSSPEFVKDMGTCDRYQAVEEDCAKGIISNKNLSHKQKCIFLDRDGTINKLNGFVSTTDLFELLPNVADAIKRINSSGYLCIVITNQPVIARGECTFEILDTIHNKMETLLGQEGAYIDGLYFCPHHPDKGFAGELTELKVICDCRKPSPGMIYSAASDYNIDLSQSWMIGDSTADIMTGKNAGLRTALVLTGEGGKDGKYAVDPDIICEDLLEFVKYINKKEID